MPPEALAQWHLAGRQRRFTPDVSVLVIMTSTCRAWRCMSARAVALHLIDLEAVSTHLGQREPIYIGFDTIEERRVKEASNHERAMTETRIRIARKYRRRLKRNPGMPALYFVFISSSRSCNWKKGQQETIGMVYASKTILRPSRIRSKSAFCARYCRTLHLSLGLLGYVLLIAIPLAQRRRVV